MVGKDELIESVWPGKVVTDDSLVQAVADIRRLLGSKARDCCGPSPRRGYMLEAPNSRRFRLRQTPWSRSTSVVAGESNTSSCRRLSADRGLGSAGCDVYGPADVPSLARHAQSPSRRDARLRWTPRSSGSWGSSLRWFSSRRACSLGTPVERADRQLDQEIIEPARNRRPGLHRQVRREEGSTLGDDLADVIAGRLVHAGVRVIGRAATARQDPSAPDFVRIGQEQGVRFVVAGRIRREPVRSRSTPT